MKGGFYFLKERNRWMVWFPVNGKKVFVSRYNGELIYHKKIAQKCLAIIQADFEKAQRGEAAFKIEKYTGKGWTDFSDFFQEWMKNVIEPVRSPATIKGYWSYYRTWFLPFFTENPVLLHEIQLDTLNKLKNQIACASKGKYNIMNCLHSMRYPKRLATKTCKRREEIR